MAWTAKKIVIIGPAYPLRGGLATFNQLLAERLQQSGHTVKIVTFSLQYPKLFFPGKTQYSSDPAPADLNIEIGINSINPLNWLKVGRRLRKEGHDLIIFRYWMPFMAPCLGSIARLIKRKSKTRIVAITDNIVPHESRWFDTPATRFFLSSCDGFVTMSRAVLADLESHGLDKPALFNPHPMYESFGPLVPKDEARAHLGLDQGRYLLFFGFIRQYKGLDILLKAMGDQVLQEMNVKLIIAGEFYEDARPYLELIEEYGLKDRIVQHSQFIPDSEVRYYFSACDMVVQTYKHATQSGVTQVAYYYDRPMLVTDVGGLAELVPNDKVGYVCPVDVAAISACLVDFYERDREGEFSKAVQQEKQRFSWESMIESLLKVSEM